MTKILFLSVLCLNPLVDGKFLTVFEKPIDGIVKGYAYRATADKKIDQDSINETLCAVFYNSSYNEVGWNVLYVQTNPRHLSDQEQAECAGRVEGIATNHDIYFHYHNNVKHWCKGRKKTCKKVAKFLKDHFYWIEKNIQELGNRSEIWHHVSVFYSHLNGLYEGYSEAVLDPKKKLTLDDFILMNLQADLEDVVSSIEKDVSAKLRGDTHCSAFIKLLPHNKDILMGHNTWTRKTAPFDNMVGRGLRTSLSVFHSQQPKTSASRKTWLKSVPSYSKMYRTLKYYNMPLRTSAHSKTTVPGHMISFSGYPGVITSGDDFYTTSYGLVAMETTIGNSNASLWVHVDPTGQLFETVRSLIALRLANNGRSWCEYFSEFNSGTYNNQWMIVDLNKFEKRKEPEEGTLYVLEQIPGYIRFEDQTSVLKQQTYWASYNVPFYSDIFNLSGNQELVDQYGDWFTYNKTARAQIFRRDHSSVTDLDSLMTLLRYNDYKNDPYSTCNCTPPYSAENAIAARSDLNSKNGSYPFAALGHRAHGAIDAKVVSSHLAKNLTFIAVCGPTTGNNLLPFCWNTSDFHHLPHMGQPNSFTKFKPLIPNWYGPIF